MPIELRQTKKFLVEDIEGRGKAECIFGYCCSCCYSPVCVGAYHHLSSPAAAIVACPCCFSVLLNCFSYVVLNNSGTELMN